jgi:hypothetical protein
MIEDFTLLKSQKNDVFRILEKNGLKDFLPSFGWKTCDEFSDYNYSTLKCFVDNREFYFVFDRSIESPSLWYPTYYPDAYIKEIQEPADGWQEVLKVFNKWCNIIKKEFIESNLWDNFISITESYNINSKAETENIFFNKNELEQLKNQLNELNGVMTESFLLNYNEQTLLNTKIEYLVELTEKQGKRDWIYTAIGVFVSVAVALSPNIKFDSRVFWNIIKELFPFSLLNY